MNFAVCFCICWKMECELVGLLACNVQLPSSENQWLPRLCCCSSVLVYAPNSKLNTILCVRFASCFWLRQRWTLSTEIRLQKARGRARTQNIRSEIILFIIVLANLLYAPEWYNARNDFQEQCHCYFLYLHRRRRRNFLHFKLFYCFCICHLSNVFCFSIRSGKRNMYPCSYRPNAIYMSTLRKKNTREQSNSILFFLFFVFPVSLIPRLLLYFSVRAGAYLTLIRAHTSYSYSFVNKA